MPPNEPGPDVHERQAVASPRRTARHGLSLRAKGLIALAGVVAAYVGLTYLVQRQVVYPVFDALEGEAAERDLTRCLEALDAEVKHLDAICADWASWDDMYRFAAQPTAEYIRANLVPGAFAHTHLNCICIYNAQGERVWGRVCDGETGAALPIRELAAGALPTDHPLLAPCATGRGCAGVFATERGPMLVACRPILTTRDEGPCRGTLVMGRLLSGNLVRGLASQTRVQLHVWPVTAANMPGPAQHALGRLLAGERIVTQRPADGTLALYATHAGLDQRPALLVQARVPRTITTRGAAAMEVGLAIVAGAGLVVMALLWLLGERLVVTPVARLSRGVSAVGRAGDPSARVPVRGADDLAQLAVDINRMLAELEAAEAGLRESERRYRLLAENSLDLIWSADLSLRFTYVSASFERALGYDAARWLGRRADEVLTRPSAEVARAALRRELEAEQQQVGSSEPQRRLDLELRRQDGSTVWTESTVSFTRDEAGEVSGLIGVTRDVSERRQAEEALRRSDRLAVVGQLAAGVAHEFNNLIGAIAGYAELALTRGGEGLTRRALEVALSCSGRARMVTRDLLTFARPQRPERRPVAVAECVEATLELLARDLQNAHIRVERHYQPAPPVAADAAQLQQVFMNLLINAWHAMPQGGGLDITIGLCPDDPQTVRVTITDTGCGIPSEELPRIFEPFHTTKTSGRPGMPAGTGLGLTVAQGIISAHGGTVEAESEVGVGTTFRVELPTGEAAAEGMMPVVPPPAAQQRDEQPLRILVVDDEEGVREVLRDLLAPLGHAVLAVPGAEEAVAALEEAAFDLVVTDLLMPKTDGTAVLAAAARRQPPCPVVVITGRTDAERLYAEDLASALAVIHKPFPLSEILEVVSRVQAA